MNNIKKFPVIDQKVLQELRSIMEDEFVDVLHIYMEDSLSLMNDIHQGFHEDRNKLLLSVSTLKSSSNNIGARRLSAIAQKIETLLNEQNYSEAALMLGELQDTFTEAHGTLSEIAKQENRLSRAL